MRDDRRDAACLRDAVRVLRARARRVTFALRVIIRVLERSADRIDGGEVTPQP